MQSDQDFTIRPADVRDAAGIGFVHCRGWQAAYAGLLPETILQGMSPEKSAARFRQEGCRDTLVAEQNGRVVGFCGYGGWRDDPDPDEGEIIGLYVLPELQRQGIGGALMKAALAELAARGCRAVSLEPLTLPDGTKAEVRDPLSGLENAAERKAERGLFASPEALYIRKSQAEEGLKNR